MNFRRDGRLYEVNGSHCSCYGLENQWDPESTTVEALRHRLTNGTLGTDSYLDNLFATELHQVLDALEATTKHYAKRDPEAQGTHYENHVYAMTTEGLHAKSAIAAELAHRDIEIERLRAALATPAQAVPASVIMASVMRDDGGEHPAFCLMVAYRAEKDAKAALAMLTDEPAQQAAPDMTDAYAGAREDSSIWKKRALEAEALNRKFAASVNSPSFMGEPAAPAQAGQQNHLPLAITSAPERIWLDLGFNPYEEDAYFSNLHDLTWSQDNATRHGIEYVRADRAAQDDSLTAAYMAGAHDAEKAARTIEGGRRAGGRKTGAAAVTAAEANWRAARTQQLLADGLDKFDAIAQVRQEARSAPWAAT